MECNSILHHGEDELSANAEFIASVSPSLILADTANLCTHGISTHAKNLSAAGPRGFVPLHSTLFPHAAKRPEVRTLCKLLHMIER